MSKNQTTDNSVEKFKEAILDAVPEEFEYYKQFIEFVPYKPPKLSSVQIPLLAITKKPMEFPYLGRPFRIIPRYPEFAVSNDGIVIEYKTKDIVEPNRKKEYYIVAINDPYVKKPVLTTIHRLVALAWVPNDDYVKKNIVDHIDDNKKNNRADNLQWVSNSKNVTKSVNKYENRWLALNRETGEILEFPSLAEVEKKLGIKRNYFHSGKCPMLIKDKDGKEWIIDDRENFSNFGATKPVYGLNNRRYYHLIIDGKIVKTYTNVMDVLKDHGRTGRKSLEDLKRFIENYYWEKGKIAKLVELNPKKEPGCYQAKNLKTGKIVEANSIANLASKLNLEESTVQTRFSTRIGKPIGDWIFKKCSDVEWPKIKEIPNKRKKIMAWNNNEKLIFNSLREAARFFNVDRRTITKKIFKSEDLKGYYLKYIEE